MTMQAAEDVVGGTSLTPPRSPQLANQEFELQWPLRYRNLVLDLGDVLCFYAPKDIPTPVSGFEMKNILNSGAWHEYERGKLTTEQCITRLEGDFQTKPGDILRTVDLLKQNLEWNERVVDFVRSLKAQANGQFRVFLMTNMAQPDFEFLRPTIEAWNLFDGFFTSAAAGARKPEAAFYQHVLKDANINPTEVIFVDDRYENVSSAQMTGMQALLFSSTDQLLQTLSQLMGNGVLRAESWLKAHAKQMYGISTTGVKFVDQFAQLMILHWSGDRDLVRLSDSTRKFNVFLDKPVMTSETYPDDLDTTAMAFLTLDVPNKDKQEVMDEMLTNTNPDGVFYTYFDPTRPRIDAFVNANLLRLFFYNDRGHQVTKLVEYMTQYVATRAYKVSTRYYHTCDWIFFSLGQLCARCPDVPQLERMRQLLREQLPERMGASTDTFSTSLRVGAAHYMGLDNPRDLEILLREQGVDGSWDHDAYIYRFGRKGTLVAHVGAVTAMAYGTLKMVPTFPLEEVTVLHFEDVFQRREAINTREPSRAFTPLGSEAALDELKTAFSGDRLDLIVYTRHAPLMDVLEPALSTYFVVNAHQKVGESSGKPMRVSGGINCHVAVS